MSSLCPPEESGLSTLFVDMNSYFASVEQNDRPELRGKPIAIVPMKTDGTCAIAASYEAKAYGIRTGTKIYDAKKMCRNLICVLARHDIYTQYHQRILAATERHLPIAKIWSIDEFHCNLIGRERQPENAAKIAKAIKAQIYKDIGPAIHCSIGIAPNSFLAKVATDIQKPNGLILLRPEDLPGRLFDLSLRDLPGININMEERLHRAGIKPWRRYGIRLPNKPEPSGAASAGKNSGTGCTDTTSRIRKRTPAWLAIPAFWIQICERLKKPA